MDQATATGRRRVPLALEILLAMLLGIVAGKVLGPRAAPLNRLGTIILDLIRGLAGPLLFFAVIDAFLRNRVRLRNAALMLGLCAINAVAALAIGLTISNVLQPGRSLRIGQGESYARAVAGMGRMTKNLDPAREIDFFEDLIAIVPTSVLRPFLDNAVLSIIILAVLLGVALRQVKDAHVARGEEDYRIVETLIGSLYQAITKVLSWAVELVPLAIFGVVARTVGEYGFEPFRGLAVYLAVGILGLAIQVLVVYQAWLIVVARVRLGWFWRGAREAIVYAMGTASSLATLPVTLRCLDRMKVSPQASRMAACVGTNLNNDGILLYEAMAVLFVAQACGVHLSLGHQLLVAAASALAGFGISGIPEAGLISLLLVLRTVHVIPDEQVTAIVPLLLTVDWVLGRCRAMTNVTSDITVAVLLDRLGRDDGEADSVMDRARPVEAQAEPAMMANDPDGI